MKKKIILVMLYCLFIVVLGAQCNKQKENESIKIGAILPLTGNSAVWGVPTKEGIELAVDQFNLKGGLNGKKVEIIYEDTKGDPKTAVTAVEKLISQDKVISILDNSNSSVTLSVAPLIEKYKIPLMVTGASSPKITQAGKYVFRIWNSDALEGELMANYSIDSLKVNNCSILYANNNYGQGLKDIFTEFFEKKGGKVISSEAFQDDASDFRTQITKIIEKKPDAIYIVSYPKQGAIILKQLKELKYNKILIGGVAFEDPDLIKLSAGSANGLIYPLPSPTDTTNSNFETFKSAFLNKFKKQIPFLADVGFDGFNVLITGIANANSQDGEKIKNSLEKIQNFNGVSGTISFDENGDVHKPFGIREIEKGKVIWKSKNLR